MLDWSIPHAVPVPSDQNGRPSVEVVIVPDAKAGGELIAEAMAQLLRRKPDALLGVATGSTPLPIYQALTAKVRGGEVDASKARIAQLDEYVGLPTGHPESYRATVLREVVEPLGLGEDSFIGPDGSAADVQAACVAYDKALAEAGGVDLQLLGIGTDGHIGFNEPCSSIASRTRIKTLTEQTITDNARFFDGDLSQVPRHVITQGIGTILEARHLVLLATGEGKADAVAATVEGPVASVVPASALQLHPHATVVVDEAAASKLKLADYFRHTYVNKPQWQGL
nr:glucosamine-6-phosphate deaminase [Streptomyces sp. SID8379]